MRCLAWLTEQGPSDYNYRIGETVVYLDHTVLPCEDGVIMIRDDFCGHLWRMISCRYLHWAIRHSSILLRTRDSGTSLEVSTSILLETIVYGFWSTKSWDLSSWELSFLKTYWKVSFWSSSVLARWRVWIGQSDSWCLSCQSCRRHSWNTRGRYSSVAWRAFCGIPGYISEFLLGVKKGESYSQYALEFSERVRAVIRNTA